MQSEDTAGPILKLGEQRGGADCAGGMGHGPLHAAGAWAGACQVHEGLHLVDQVQIGICRTTKAHVVALVLLVLLVDAAVERRASWEGDQSLPPVA